jgi:SAM domain (Sterile alpha motif)
MQQVADWLEKLGLGQYAQRFAENDIDFALLTKLTDANLKELGVTSLGHRMRLLEGSHSAETAFRGVQSLRQGVPIDRDLAHRVCLGASTPWCIQALVRPRLAARKGEIVGIGDPLAHGRL